jgi:hypothetical protein
MYACYLQTEAEKAGWEFSKKEGIPLVVINPTFVLGPVVGKRADATSIIDFKVQLSSSPAIKSCETVTSLLDAHACFGLLK